MGKANWKRSCRLFQLLLIATVLTGGIAFDLASIRYATIYSVHEAANLTVIIRFHFGAHDTNKVSII
jgi:hypothetical protein